MPRTLFLVIMLVSLFSPSRSVAAAGASYVSPLYGFEVTWDAPWVKNDARSQSSSLNIDALHLEWNEEISVEFIGFLSLAVKPDAIAMDFLANFVASDGTSKIRQQAFLDAEGSLQPTIVSWVDQNGETVLLSIYPYSLPNAGTVFAVVWESLETTPQSEIDTAAASFAITLPETVEEEGYHAPSPGTRATQAPTPPPARVSCPGFSAWQSAITAIYADMNDAIREFIDSPHISGWDLASVGITADKLLGYQSDLLHLGDPEYSLAATDYLMAALENYWQVFFNANLQISGGPKLDPAEISNLITAAQANAALFESEMLRLQSYCL